MSMSTIYREPLALGRCTAGARAYLLAGMRWKGFEWSFRYRLQRDRQWRHHIGGFIEWAAD